MLIFTEIWAKKDFSKTDFKKVNFSRNVDNYGDIEKTIFQSDIKLTYFFAQADIRDNMGQI